MYLTKCIICSSELKEHNKENNKYICSNNQCQAHFEIMDVEKRDNLDNERAVKYYKENNSDEGMITYCEHCNSILDERCSMPTIGSRGKKRTTILTCSNNNCNSEYHVTDDLEAKTKYLNNGKHADKFRTIEIYK